MNRKDLVKKVAEKTDMTQKAVEQFLVAYENTIYDALQEEGIVKAMDGITFAIKSTKPRIGRNPKTGDEIKIPEGKKIAVRFGKTVKDFLKEF